MIGAGVIAVCLVLVGVLGTLLVDVRSVDHRAIDKNQAGAIADNATKKALENLRSAPPPGVEVYNAIRPPLVAIKSDAATGPGSPVPESLGTGVIINDDGAILTALHVVDRAKSIQVLFSDGSESSATIERSDPDHDIAVLTAATLPQVVVPAVLGDGARIGDETFAVGNPLGLVGSLTAGVISALDRSFPLRGRRSIDGLIQFDAAVNPGSSGGPLLNTKGQVIGIVTGLANPAGDSDFVGIGFAVPISTAGGAAGAPAQ